MSAPLDRVAPARRVLADAGPTDRVPPFRFSARFRVEVADTDLNAHTYYGAYLRYIDRAAMAYRAHLGIDAMGAQGHTLVARAVSLEYLGSAVLDDELEVLVRVGALGRTSHTAEVRIERRGPEPAHLLDGRLTVVGLTGLGGRPSPMPEAMRVALAGFEGL